mgnify:CR=1 FL=1
MAVSKNNRRKKGKRTQNHSAPAAAQKSAKREVEVQQKQKEKQALWLNIAGIAVMIVGFILAWRGYRFAGYPITFIGALAGLIATRLQGGKRKGTIIGYTVYCIMVAYLWIFEFFAS